MKREEGFTLIELLIAMSLSGIVLGILATAFVVSFGATQDSEQQLLETQAAGFSSANLTQDVASAVTVTPDSSTCTGPAGTAVLTLTWTDVSTNVAVDYRFDASSGTVSRYEYRSASVACSGAVTTSAFATSLSSAKATLLTAPSGKQGVRLVLSGRLGTSQDITAYRRLG